MRTSVTTTAEYSTYFRPQGLAGIEALHARFVRHAYRPHSHPTWTVAVVERGAARFDLDATKPSDSIAVEEAVLGAVAALRPHLRPGPPARGRDRAEHPAVRRARRAFARVLGSSGDPGGVGVDGGSQPIRARSRRFREQTGVTPHAFQTNLRVEAARRMLAAGVPPAEVAAGCGFADQPHLTRVFKRAVGVSPGRYARAQ